ncbi:MAG: TonB family protein [Acidobacteria bacterium]|nr:TonB family protein [Acidobacteriota bacterium]
MTASPKSYPAGYAPHLSSLILTMALDSELPAAEVAGVEQHLLSCAECRGRFESLHTASEAIRLQHAELEEQILAPPPTTHIPQHFVSAGVKPGGTLHGEGAGRFRLADGGVSGYNEENTLMSTPSMQPNATPVPGNGPGNTPGGPTLPPLLPTLFGEGYGIYGVKRGSFVASYALVTVIAVAIVLSGRFVVTHTDQIKKNISAVVTDISPYILQPSKKQAGGGGGGGDHDKFEASKGSLPKFAKDQFTPPVRVIRNPNPVLPVTPTVVVPPQIKIASNMPVIGDPFSHNINGPESNGTGTGGGIGSGSGGGVGSGTGPGVGPGYGGGIGGGVYSVGGGVSAPKPIFDPDPDYSDEARKAKYQGIVELLCVIGPDGRVRDVRVQRSLGMGLDEKAIEAVRKWRFEPSRLNGVAVAVNVLIDVNFHLY